jgi:hypothetical protein
MCETVRVRVRHTALSALRTRGMGVKRRDRARGRPGALLSS